MELGGLYGGHYWTLEFETTPYDFLFFLFATFEFCLMIRKFVVVILVHSTHFLEFLFFLPYLNFVSWIHPCEYCALCT